MGGAVPKRWRSVWCMLCVIHVSARLCRRAACLCRTHMAIARLRSTYVTVCMPVHLYRSTALGAYAPWLPEGGEAAHIHPSACTCLSSERSSEVYPGWCHVPSHIPTRVPLESTLWGLSWVLPRTTHTLSAPDRPNTRGSYTRGRLAVRSSTL